MAVEELGVLDDGVDGEAEVGCGLLAGVSGEEPVGDGSEARREVGVCGAWVEERSGGGCGVDGRVWSEEDAAGGGVGLEEEGVVAFGEPWGAAFADEAEAVEIAAGVGEAGVEGLVDAAGAAGEVVVFAGVPEGAGDEVISGGDGGVSIGARAGAVGLGALDHGETAGVELVAAGGVVGEHLPVAWGEAEEERGVELGAPRDGGEHAARGAQGGCEGVAVVRPSGRAIGGERGEVGGEVEEERPVCGPQRGGGGTSGAHGGLVRLGGGTSVKRPMLLPGGGRGLTGLCGLTVASRGTGLLG